MWLCLPICIQIKKQLLQIRLTYQNIFFNLKYPTARGQSMKRPLASILNQTRTFKTIEKVKLAKKYQENSWIQNCNIIKTWQRKKLKLNLKCNQFYGDIPKNLQSLQQLSLSLIVIFQILFQIDKLIHHFSLISFDLFDHFFFWPDSFVV